MTTYQATSALDTYNPTDAKLQEFLTKWYAAFETGSMEQASDTGQFDETTITLTGLPTSSASPAYQIHKLNDSLFSTAPVYVKTGFYNSSGYIRYMVSLGTSTNGSGNLTGLTFPLVGAGNVNFATDTTIDIIGSGAEGYASVFMDPGGTITSNPQQTYYCLGVFRTTDEDDQPDSRGVLLTYYYPTTTGGVGGAGMRYVAIDFQSMTYSELGAHGFWQFGSTTGSANPTLRKDVSRVVIPFSGFTWVCPHLIGTYREEHSYGTPFVANPSGNPHQYQQIKGVRYSGVNAGGAYSTLAVIWE